MKVVDFKRNMKELSKDNENEADGFKEELMEAYIKKGIVDVLSSKEFLHLGGDGVAPHVIARAIHQSGLDLDHAYVYIPHNGEYGECKEADTFAELYDLIKGDHYIEKLDEQVLDNIYSNLTMNISDDCYD